MAADEKGRRKDAASRARIMEKRKGDSMPIAPEMEGPQLVREVDAPLVPPAPKGGYREVFRRRYLLRLIVRRQLASQYAASLLGLFWSYLQPGLRFAIYYFLVGMLKDLGRMPNFALHLFVGMVVVHFFGEAWGGGTRSIWNNRSLVLKMRVPRETFPAAALVVAAIHTFPQLVLLVGIDLAIGWHVDLEGVLAGMLGLAIIVVFSTAMGLGFAALNAMYRDWQNIVQTMMQVMHFLVPMLYPFTRIYSFKEAHPIPYEIYMANPVAQSVILFQRLLWYPTIDDPTARSTWCDAGEKSCQVPEVIFPPDMWTRGLITLGLCILLLILAQWYFKKFEAKIPERL